MSTLVEPGSHGQTDNVHHWNPDEPISQGNCRRCEGDNEPILYTCSTCRQVFQSAWTLLQHAQIGHGLKIFLDITAIPSPSLDPGSLSLLRMPLGERSPQFPPPIFPRGRPSSQDFPVPPLLSEQFRLNPFPPAPFDRAPFVPPDTPEPPPKPAPEVNLEFYSQRLNELGGSTSPPVSKSKTPPLVTPSLESRNTEQESVEGSSSPKQHACDLCGKTFRLQSNLISHKRSHTGDLQFKCSSCDFLCAQSSKLKRHLKIHSAEKGSSELDDDSPSSRQDSGDGESSMTEADDDEDDDDELDEDETEEGDTAQDLSFKVKSPSPLKSPIVSVQTPSSTTSTTSLVSELMSKYGLGNIQSYNEAYRAALKESGDKLPHPPIPPGSLCVPPSEHPNENGADKRKMETRSNGLEKSFRMRDDMPPNVYRPAFDPLEAVKRLKMEYESSAAGTSPDGRDNLYAGLWLPAIGPPPYPIVPGPGGLPSMPPNSDFMKLPSLDSMRNFNNSFSPSPQPPKDKRRKDSCEYCGKVFKNCSNLTVHRRSHTGEKPYKCDLCSYACAQSSKLTRHMRTHGRMGKDVYRCRFCNMPFSVPSTLEKHMRKCVVTQTKKINLPPNDRAGLHSKARAVEKALAAEAEKSKLLPTLIPMLSADPSSYSGKILSMAGEVAPS